MTRLYVLFIAIFFANAVIWVAFLGGTDQSLSIFTLSPRCLTGKAEEVEYHRIVPRAGIIVAPHPGTGAGDHGVVAPGDGSASGNIGGAASGEGSHSIGMSGGSDMAGGMAPGADGGGVSGTPSSDTGGVGGITQDADPGGAVGPSEKPDQAEGEVTTEDEDKLPEGSVENHEHGNSDSATVMGASNGKVMTGEQTSTDFTSFGLCAQALGRRSLSGRAPSNCRGPIRVDRNNVGTGEVTSYQIYWYGDGEAFLEVEIAADYWVPYKRSYGGTTLVTFPDADELSITIKFPNLLGEDTYFVTTQDPNGFGYLVNSAKRLPAWAGPARPPASTSGGRSGGQGGGRAVAAGGGRAGGRGSRSGLDITPMTPRPRLGSVGTNRGPRLGSVPTDRPDGLSAPEGIVLLRSDSTGDGLRFGSDANGVALTKDWMERIMETIPVRNRRAVFYTDQGQADMMSEFIYERLEGRGFDYFKAFGRNPAEMYPRMPEGRRFARLRNLLWFMGIYRGSRAVAQQNRAPDIYVILQRVVDDVHYRNIFDPVERRIPGSIGVGQVWHDIELPTLMRNPYVHRIIVIQKMPDGTWEEEVQWDVNDPMARARDSIPLISLDDITFVPQVPNTRRLL